MKLPPWQLSTLVGSLAVIGMGAIMTLTNPQRNAYQSYAARQASLYLQENACTKAPEAFGKFLEQQCKSLTQVSQPYVKPLINLSTRRHNYIFFSVYETQFSLNRNLPAYSVKTVGFLNLFWTYENGLQVAKK